MFLFLYYFRKKYLLSPVPFTELTSLVSIATERVQEVKVNGSESRRKYGNMDNIESCLSSYLDILSNSVNVIQQVR